MTTGKTIALTRQTFVDKVMSLLFNVLDEKYESCPCFKAEKRTTGEADFNVLCVPDSVKHFILFFPELETFYFELGCKFKC